MLVTSAILVASLIGFGLTSSFVPALLLIWIIAIVRSLNDPLYTTWVNQRLDSSVRATVLSMSSQMDAIGQIITGPFVGLVGKFVSVQAALSLTGIILSPVLWLIRRVIHQERTPQKKALSRRQYDGASQTNRATRRIRGKSHPTTEHQPAIASLLNICYQSLNDWANISSYEIARNWEFAGFNPQSDAWIVLAPGAESQGHSAVPGLAAQALPARNCQLLPRPDLAVGDRMLVGYGEFLRINQHVVLRGEGYVHPDFRGLGIGTTLLSLYEDRVREELPLCDPASQVILRIYINQRAPGAVTLLEKNGFKEVRHVYVMEIELDSPPAQPVWPAGITSRPYLRGEDDLAIYSTLREAFRDHWTSIFPEFAGWRTNLIGREDFDPGLAALALQGDLVAGTALGSFDGGNGWVNTLGVRRAYRHQGLGMALLLQMFNAFYAGANAGSVSRWMPAARLGLPACTSGLGCR